MNIIEKLHSITDEDPRFILGKIIGGVVLGIQLFRFVFLFV